MRILNEYIDGEYTITEYTQDGETVSYTVKEATPKIEYNAEYFKPLKILELNKMCEQTIEAGFTSNINGHVYRTNRDDQINMMGQKDELMDDPAIETVPWKTEDVGYIKHTRADWLNIYKEGLQHKKAQLFKYDQLKKQVLAAQTIDEINAVQW